MLKICFVLLILWLASTEANRIQVANVSSENGMYDEWIALDKELKTLMSSAMKFLPPGALGALSNLNLTTQCTSQLFKVFLGAIALDLWALKFIDSNGKMIDGLLQGTNSALGNYHECTEIFVPRDEHDPRSSLSFQGKYCLIKIKIHLPSTKKYSNMNEFKKNSQLWKSLSGFAERCLSNADLLRLAGMSWALCVPSGCSSEDVKQMVTYVGSNIAVFEPELVRCEIKEETQFDTSFIVSTCLFSAVGFLVLCGSLIELYKQRYGIKIENMGLRILLAFSLIQNTKRLLDTKESENTLHFLHGFRFFTLVWIITCHRFMLTAASIEAHANSYQVVDYFSRYGFQLLLNGFYSVDSFFFMSGMLNSYIGLKAVKNLTISRSLFYVFVHRLWRIYPVYIFSILGVFFLPLLGSGQIYNKFKDELISNCKNNWWTNILFINNIVNIRTEMCLIHSWFLSCQLQLFFGAIILMMVMVKRPKVGIALNVIIILVSILYIAIYTWIYDLPPALLLRQMDIEGANNYFLVYSKPFMHVQPYFIGFLFGNWLMKKKNVTLSKKCQFMGWIIFVTFMHLTIFATKSWNAGKRATVLESVFYSSISRILYSIAISWMIFCCYTGYGGIVNTILSWKVWYPVSRLCFAAYLVSLTIQGVTVANSKTLLSTTIWDKVWRCIGDIFFSLLTAYVLSMLVEAPAMSLEKLFHVRINEDNQNNLEYECNKSAYINNTFDVEASNKTAKYL